MTGQYLLGMAIKSVGVLGSGIMGSGIAEVAAKTGHEVILRSRKKETAEAMVTGLEKSLAKQVDRGKLSDEDRTAVLGRVQATDDLEALSDCDLIIESVVEDLEIKRELFGELDRTAKGDAILATNTSTLPVIEMAMATERPSQVVGVHFFNPAPMMSLVEIVRPLTASDETVASVTEFARTCGKDPVEVKDRAGFIVNALLFPYLNNAVRMLENGPQPRRHRHRMKGGCTPDGPAALLDLVGSTRRWPSSTPPRRFKDPNYAASRSCAAWSARHSAKSKQGFFETASSGDSAR